MRGSITKIFLAASKIRKHVRGPSDSCEQAPKQLPNSPPFLSFESEALSEDFGDVIDHFRSI